MSTIQAKPIIDGKFWLIEDGGSKIGILKRTEQDHYVLSSKDSIVTFDDMAKLEQKFGDHFFKAYEIPDKIEHENIDVHGFPANSIPYEPVYDVKKRLPLFKKSKMSKSVFCAGYFLIKFNEYWVKTFCPKLITVERYPYMGPFSTKEEQREIHEQQSKLN